MATKPMSGATWLLVNTFGNDNKNNVAAADPKPGDSAFSADAEHVQRVRQQQQGAVKGNTNLTNVVGNENKVSVKGNTNLTSVFGNGNKVTKWGKPGVKGDNNITTIVGNESKASAKGNGNLTSVFGSRSTARSSGDNKVTTAVGDDKKNVNGEDQS